jgi:hypothetical protein
MFKDTWNAYGVIGLPQWERDIIIPQGMAFIILISSSVF